MSKVQSKTATTKKAATKKAATYKKTVTNALRKAYGQSAVDAYVKHLKPEHYNELDVSLIAQKLPTFTKDTPLDEWNFAAANLAHVLRLKEERNSEPPIPVITPQMAVPSLEPLQSTTQKDTTHNPNPKPSKPDYKARKYYNPSLPSGEHHVAIGTMGLIRRNYTNYSQTTVQIEGSTLAKFARHCLLTGITTDEGIRQLIEAENDQIEQFQIRNIYKPNVLNTATTH